MKKILVTGCAGFIGFHLLGTLLEKNTYDVYGVDNFSRQTNDDFFDSMKLESRFTFLEGDLNDPMFVNSLPERFDIIFHLATINGTQNFYEIPFDVAASCAIPTWNLINKYKTASIEKFILAGTPESYATSVELGIAGIPTPEEVPLSISSPQEPRWSYAAGKIFAEALVCGAAKQFNFPIAIARFHNVYGPRMGPHHFIPDFLTRAVKGDYSVYGSKNTRSFLYVDDAISDLIKISELSDERQLILNIGSSEEVEVGDLAKTILKTLGIKNDLAVFDAPSHSVSRRIPDLTKIDAILGERSRIKLHEGLARCIVEYFPEFEGVI